MGSSELVEYDPFLNMAHLALITTENDVNEQLILDQNIDEAKTCADITVAPVPALQRPLIG